MLRAVALKANKFPAQRSLRNRCQGMKVSMRFVNILLAVSSFLLFSCKKNLQLGSSSFISWNDCSETRSDQIKICFDSLLEDSRCPKGAMCFWQGRAVAKFSFTVNKDQRTITLATFAPPGFTPTDTILLGYKIELVNMRPYPELNKNHNASEYRAELKITKQ
jgi:hypothetical protein